MLLRVLVPPIRWKLLNETLVFLSLKVQEWHSLTQNLFPQQSSWRLSFNVFFLDIVIFFFARVFTTGQHKQTSRTVKTKWRYVQWLYLIALQISVEFLHSSLCISKHSTNHLPENLAFTKGNKFSLEGEFHAIFFIAFKLLHLFLFFFLPLSSMNRRRPEWQFFFKGFNLSKIWSLPIA